MTPKRAIAYLLKYMTQLLPSNNLWLCGAPERRADKKYVGLTLNQLTPKLPQKGFSLPNKVHGPNFAR